MSPKSKQSKHSLWYEYMDNEPVRLRIEDLPSSAEEPSISDIKKEIVKGYDLKIGNITLKIKHGMETDYKELNTDLFNSCENNYVTLKESFNITKDNPIMVEG